MMRLKTQTVGKAGSLAGLLLVFGLSLPAASPVKLTGKILGVVTNATGVPQMGASVMLLDRLDRVRERMTTDEKGDYKILTDIQGPEDHHGDMDCKVAGTSDGVTAIQMDVKIQGLTLEILKEVFLQAKKARWEILEFMNKTIGTPRPRVSSFAPVVMSIKIKPEQIGEVIGPGGRIINAIIKETGALTIDIEQTGQVFVAAIDQEKAEAAIRQIKSLTREFQIGDIVEGEVIRILEFGAIVDLGGGKDGMIHVSELKEGFVEKVEDVVKINDHVRAKVIKIENGRIGLSLKAMKSR